MVARRHRAAPHLSGTLAALAPTTAMAEQHPAKPGSRCPRLGTALNPLLDAPDPAAFAYRHGLDYEGGRVRVEITLRAPEGDLAQRYGLTVESRHGGKYLWALAPLASLCGLANDARVEGVDSRSLDIPEAGP